MKVKRLSSNIMQTEAYSVTGKNGQQAQIYKPIGADHWHVFIKPAQINGYCKYASRAECEDFLIREGF